MPFFTVSETRCSTDLASFHKSMLCGLSLMGTTEDNILSLLYRVEVFSVLLQNHLDSVQQVRAQIHLAQARLVQLVRQVYLVAQQLQSLDLVLILPVQPVLVQLSVLSEERTHLWGVVAFLGQQGQQAQEVAYLVHKTRPGLELAVRWALVERVHLEVELLLIY